MADPRFFDNRGPFRLAELRSVGAFDLPDGIDADALIHDVAGLAQAGASHLSFFDNNRARKDFLASSAGYCLVKRTPSRGEVPKETALLACGWVGRAFASIAKHFYPEHELAIQAQDVAVHPTARLDDGVVLGPGVVVGPHAEIGAHTRIGPNSVIGRGVAIGRNCEIGPNVTIGFAYLGDEVVLQPGVVIGGSGFGFVSGADGHIKMPQLGRVIVQDRVEIGSNSTVDRGALGDTVIGEGSKIDNIVQIGHNSRMGRHCILAGQSGLAGSAVLGDFVIVGGLSGVSDHVTVASRVRVAGMSGVTRDLEEGCDYGGIPARPIREWHRQAAVLAKLTKRDKRTDNE